MKFEATEDQLQELRVFVSSFCEPRRKARFLALLDTKNGRQTVLAGLDHVAWLDSRYCSLVPPNLQTIRHIGEVLRKGGAPALCHLLSSIRSLNNLRLPLDAALTEVLGGGSGTIVFCVRGRLAYYESEEPGERYICSRTDLQRGV